MENHSLKTLVLSALVVTNCYTYAEDQTAPDLEAELSPKGLNLTPENPITPFALKKNGKARGHFKIPYSALVEYYKFSGQGTVLENTNSEILLDMEMDIMSNLNKQDVEFYFDLKRKKAYPLKLINPHSVSDLFVLDPKAYTNLAAAPDFLTAKRKIYAAQDFTTKTLRYKRDFVHLEDWRSLNHPPVQHMGDDLTIWDKDYTPIDFGSKESVYYTEKFQRNIDKLSNTELTFGNTISLLANGDSFKRKITEIKQAKKSVLIAVMSFFCDKSSRQLEDVLINKVAQGVDVKLMVEKVWTRIAMKKMYEPHDRRWRRCGLC